MRGLLKNNLYAALASEKSFFAAMLLFGVAAVAAASQTLLLGYALLCMVGFPTISIFGLFKESASKWGRYKLTAPVRRSDIVKSSFCSQLIWLLLGVSLALVVMGLSTLLHGPLFDKSLDSLTIITAGVSVSLFMNGLFLPLYYNSDGERNEVLLVLSLLCAIGIVMGLSGFVNWLFGAHMTTAQLLAGMALMVLCAIGAVCVSFPLTVRIFKQKEC